jgi:hypothetical protein
VDIPCAGWEHRDVARVERLTPDLSEYPDLVMILLGLRVRTLRGLRTFAGLGPQIEKSAQTRPEGLLAHNFFFWSLLPPHGGIRQYWRDLDSLERWTRSDPHRTWWLNFMRDTGGTGFWHEAYFMRGGIDAIYDDVGASIGLASFAPATQARGRMFSSRERSGHAGEPAAPVVGEAELYGAAAPAGEGR